MPAEPLTADERYKLHELATSAMAIVDTDYQYRMIKKLWRCFAELEEQIIPEKHAEKVRGLETRIAHQEETIDVLVKNSALTDEIIRILEQKAAAGERCVLAFESFQSDPPSEGWKWRWIEVRDAVDEYRKRFPAGGPSAGGGDCPSDPGQTTKGSQ